MLTLDADFAEQDFWQRYIQLCDYEAVLYSTHSHRPDHCRFRLIIPLSKPVDPIRYEAIARMIARDVGIDLFDDTTYEPNRLMYWPSCPANGEYVFKHQEGDWLDPDEVLDRYHDWHDERTWPVSSRVDARVRSHIGKQGDPEEKPGMIGSFCRTYNVRGAIAAFLPDVYKHEGEDRYTFIGGSTYGGMKTFDNDRFMYSWHSTDPLHERLLNAFDLVRLHLFRALDENVDEETTPINEMPSYHEMLNLCMKDADVIEDYKAHMTEEGVYSDPAFKNYTGMFTDQDVARRVARTYTGKLLYNPGIGWLGWNGHCWEVNESAAIRACFSVNNELLEDARLLVATSEGDDKKAAQAALKKVESLRSAGRVSGIVKFMTAEPDLRLNDVDELDPDPWLLNTPNYVLDLRTGDIRKHDAGLKCSHVTLVSPKDAPSPLWDSFLDYVTQGDDELKEYLQLTAGAACVGQVFNEGLILAYGPGGNGKSTFYGILLKLLGDYATTIRSDVLIQRNNGSEPYGIENVRGRRLVIMGETDEGARFSVSVMKRLTSRDMIEANAKYKQPFAFTPTHKLILHTNHLPRLGQLDTGTLRRIKVVPFMAPRKTGDEVIPDLAERIIEQEGGQVLHWMVEGAKKFCDLGCRVSTPKCVAKQTTEYVGGEDWMGMFLEEKCLIGDSQSVSGSALYEAYRRWADDNGEFKRRNRDFAKALEERGFIKEKRHGVATWCGIGLQDDVV